VITVDGAGTVVLSATDTFAGGIVLSQGTLDLAASGAAGSGTISLSNSPVLQIDAAALPAGGSFANSIDGFVTGMTLDLTGLDFVTGATAQVTAGVLKVTSGDITDLLPTPDLPDSNAFAVSRDSGTGSEVTPLCFCAGTRIATPMGEVRVERLSVGDLVITHGGATRPIVWIGIGAVLATRGRRNAATPVIVYKGALADNVPARDLRVTKGHALYLDGVLIPVEFLVNHRSIAWDDRAQEVKLYHIELDTHDVLIANGVPAESYRDDGNRWLFRNANSSWDLPPLKPFAPVLTGGPIVDAAWQRLARRAGARPGLPVTEDPDLHLLVDGQRVNASSRAGKAYLFRLSRPPTEIRIVSRAAAAQELGAARDARVLGVAVKQILLRQGRRLRMIEAADSALDDGFHLFEPDNAFRWTNGDARVPPALFADVCGRCELELQIGCTALYAADAAVA
jgi:autotransporter-associated beta strand protein